jgi:hypothetical protein
VLVQVTVVFFKNGPKYKTSDAGNLDMPSRNCKVYPSCEKVKAPHLIMKEKY